MITKKTSENAGLYDKLFADASEVLGAPIKTLDEYLFNLEALRQYEVEDEQYSLRFSRLPVDEPPFVIDANARQIEIPASFKKNGVAVIGDHLAEILYFTIDRYYDTWDLLDDDIQVIVQWTHMEAGKEKESGISIIKEKDSKVFASEGKIMFGWPINNTVAEKAGSIKFSVRFFKIADGHLIFNMNTIPTTVEVKNGLDFVNADGDLLANAIDDSLLVSYRFKNGLGYQGGEGGAEKPVYIIPLSFYTLDEEDNPVFEEVDFGTESSTIVDLNEDGTLTFGVSATGNGDVTYVGYKDSSTNSIPTEFFYAITEDTTARSDKNYFTYDETTGEYTMVAVSAFEDGVDYYDRIAGITADSVGTYWIVTTNTMRPSAGESDTDANWSRYDDKSKEIIVPGPLDPSIEAPASVYLDEENKLYVEVSGSTEQRGDEIICTLTDGESINMSSTESGYSEGKFFVGTITGTEEEPVNKYDKTFTVSVVSKRNGASSDPVTATVRATYPTEKPVVIIANENDITATGTTTGTIKANVANADSILHEEFTYQWYQDTQFSEALTDDILIEGATSSTYTPTNTGVYYCIVTNTVNGLSAPSETFNKITVVVNS